jgi:hypothetical protein
MRLTSDEETLWAPVDYAHEMIQSVRPRAKTDNLASLLLGFHIRLPKTANNGYGPRLMERWVAFRHYWESEEELLRAGPSKSEYFFLVLIYPYLYLLSGIIHELGHVIGALIAGDPIVMISLTPTVFSVTVQGIGRSLILARSMGGLFQGMFLSVFAQRYRFLWSVTAACFVYAIAEATGVLWLMFVCSFFSEIVGTLIIIYLAC